MTFGEKVKQLRKEKRLRQDEVAKAVGVSTRTIAAYEAGGRYPRKPEIYEKLAEILGCPRDYLLTEKEEFVEEAGKKYGSRGRKQATEAINSLSGLFAGGELSEQDRDEVFRAITQMYWKAKEENKKYTPKKYRDHD